MSCKGLDPKQLEKLQRVVAHFMCCEQTPDAGIADLLRSDAEAQKLHQALERVLQPLSKAVSPKTPDGLAEQTLNYLRQRRQAQEMARVSAALAAQKPTVQARVARERQGRLRWVLWNSRNGIAAAASILIMFLITQPGLQHARQLSNQIACAGQLHGIAGAFAQYATDHADYMPYVSNLPGDIWWKVGLEGEVNQSNTRNLFLLVRQDYICPEQLFCPAVPREQINVQMLELSPNDLHELRDFLCHRSVSYSVCWMFGGRPVRMAESKRMVVMTDKNPLFAQIDCHNFPQFGWEVKPEHLQQNSPNHQGRGQNVLERDGSVVFLQTRMLPGTDDDFYMIQNADYYDGNECPASARDEFVAP